MTAEDWKRRSVCRAGDEQRQWQTRGAKTNLEVLGDFTNKTLEGQLSDEELGGLLVTSNFTESDGSWTESRRCVWETGEKEERGMADL